MPEIVLLVDIAAPPAAIFPLIAEASGIHRWWTAESTAAVRLRRREILPERRVRWLCTGDRAWRHTSFLIELERTRTGASLWFAVSDPGETSARWCRNCAALGAALFRIKAAAEERATPPLQSWRGGGGRPAGG